jgi:hypothetical protein
MTLSYTLFLALLLLAPGIATWAGLQFGAPRQMITRAPERPGSTTTLAIIVFGAMIGHFLLSCLLALMDFMCDLTAQCIAIHFDPNIYRVTITGAKAQPGMPAEAYAWWLFALIIPSVLMALLASLLVRSRRFARWFEPATFGWLMPLIEKSREPNHSIIAWVVTSIESEGCNIGYMGNVGQLSFDENKAVTMLTLRECEMFLLRNTGETIMRIPVQRKPIPLLHLQAKDLANVAFQVIEVAT